MSDFAAFATGDVVRVVAGRFTPFRGMVEGVNETGSQVKVAVSISGRVTTVDLKFVEIELV